MAQRTIRYGIAFDVDKVSLQNIQQQLKGIMNTPSDGMNKSFEQTKQTASSLYNILKQCYNQDLGTLNVQKFNSMLKQSKITLENLKSLGPSTFNQLGMAVNAAKLKIKETNGFLTNIVKTLTDSAKWSLAYGLINKVSQNLNDAINYVKDLDTSLNDIRIVTEKSAEEMSNFAQEANKAAISLGASTKAYTDASLIYYQQGLGDAEAKERARITTMAANVTGQSASQVSEMLTAIWNGYKVSASEAELYIDKVAKVAAQTGADLEELATGMSKVASAANIMGVDVDELNAQLATVITVTRQAPESVGTAFKTIYARINAIESGSEDAETTLKQYTQAMLEYGVKVLDMNGKLRDTGDVIKEIGEKWGTMTKEQQLGLAQAMAGQRQYNNLLALFDNWDMQEEALNASINAMGTLQKQQNIYLDSTAAHMEQMDAKFEKLYSTILTSDTLNVYYDFVGNIASTLDNVFSSFGGGLFSLVPIILSIASLFSKNIAHGIFNFLSGIDRSKENLKIVQNQVEAIRIGIAKSSEGDIIGKTWQKGYSEQLKYLEQMHNVRKGLTQEAQNEVTEGATRIGQLEQELELERALAKSQGERLTKEFNEAFGLNDKNGVNFDGVEILENRASGFSDDNLGKLNLSAYEERIEKAEKELLLRKDIVQTISEESRLFTENGTRTQEYEKALQRISNINDARVNNSKILLNDAKKQVQAAQQALNTAKEEGASKEKIQKLQKNLNQAIQKEKNELKKVLEAIKKSNAELDKKNKKQREAVDNVRVYKKEVLESSQGYAKGSAELQNLKLRLNEVINSGSKLNAITSGVMGAMGSISSLAMGWSMVSSIMTTLEDETASVGDKITQVIMSASMGIPMMISGLGQLRQALGYETSLLQGIQALREKSIAQKMISNDLLKAENAEQILNIGITGNSLALQDRKIDITALQIYYGEMQAETEEEKLRALLAMDAKTAESIGIDYEKVTSLKAVRNANEKLKTSLLGNPVLLAIMIALAATLGAVAMAASHASKQLEKSIELNNKLIEEENAYQEQIKTNGELYNSYMELYKAYEKTGEATEDFKNKQQELIDLYKIELTEIEKLTLGYDGLQAKIWEARKAEILGEGEKNKGLLDSAQKELGAAQQLLFTSAIKEDGRALGGNKYILDINTGANTSVDEKYIMDLLLEEYGGVQFDTGKYHNSEKYKNINSLEGFNLDFFKGYDPTIGILENNYKGYVEIYELFTETVSRADTLYDASQNAASEMYDLMTDWLKKMKPAVEAYKTALEDVSKYSLTETIFNLDITGAENLEEFASKYKIAKEALKEKIIEQEGPDADLSDERIEAVAQATFTEIDEAYSEMISDMGLAEEILDSWKLDENEKQKVTSELYSLIESIPEEDKILLIQMGLDKAKSIEEVQNIIDSLNIVVAKNKLDLQLGYTNETIKTLQEGKNLTEEQIANLQELEANYEELAEAAAEVGRESKEYLAILKEIREVQEDAQSALNASNYKVLKENAQKKRPKPSGLIISDRGEIELPKISRGELPNFSYDTDEVEEYTDALLEANAAQIELYKSSNLIFEGQNFSFNDLVSDLDDIETYAEKAAKAIELIGEGFLVAASDVQELLTLFPELAEQSNVLATGELQLNKEVTEAVIGGKNEISKATLNNLLVEIEANRMRAEADLQLVTETLNNFDTIERGERKKVLNGLTANDEYVTQVINDSETVAEDVGDNNKSLGEQTVSMYQAMEAAADDYGRNTAQILNNPSDINAADMYSVQTYEAYLKSLGGASAPATSNSTKDGTRKLSDLQLDPEAFWAEIDKTEKEALESWQTSLQEIIAEYTQQESTIKGFLTQLQNIGTGSGGKNKDTKTPDDIEPFEPEIDRYHEINREISSIQKEREKLEKEAENLIGQALIDNLKKQNELLDKQNAKIKEKISLLQKEALELKENLQLGIQINDETIKIQFDGDEISNYTEALTTAKREVNELIQAYNAGKSTLTETQLEELKQKIDDAQEVYDLLVSMIERYEEIMFEEIPSAEEEFQDNLDEAVDNAIEAFKMQIEIDLDLHDLQMKWREFQRTMTFDEDAFGSITKIAEDKLGDLEAYYGPGGIIEKLTNHVNSMVSGEGKGVYGDHTKDYLDDLKNYAEELMTNLEDAEEIIKEIRAAVGELMEEASEAFDTQISRYEALNATLEHNIALLNLLDGEDNNYAAKQAFYDKQNENFIAQLAFNKQQVEFWQKQLDMAEEGTEAYKIAEENLIAAIETSQSTLEAAIEAAQTAHINSIRAIFEELENQITGGKGVSFLNEEWELIKDNADFYLDDVNEAYELSKLEANYRKAIDESSSLSAQKRINEMMNSELAMLKEKDKLTKYDIDRANLKYQLTLKQIALEDAQKNKSSMRLKRDASGNYSYQYVADSSATSQLEQEIADLNNQIHNLDKEALRSNLDAILQVWQEYQEALIKIEEQGGTEEEKAQKRYVIQQQYAKKFEDLARNNQHLLNTISADTIASVTGNFDNGVQDMIDRIQGAGGFESVMEEAYDKIIERSHEYENTVHQMAAAVGTDLDDIYAGVDKNIDILGDLIEKNNDVIYSYEQEMQAMWRVIGVLDDMIAKYAATRQAAMDAASAAVSAYQTIARAGTANNSEYSDDTDWARRMAQEFVANNIWTDEAGHRNTKISKTGSDWGVSTDRLINLFEAAQNGNNEARQLIERVNAGQAYFTDEALKRLGFNTGGYTGEWANGDIDGKLALLHQKELVLNSKDTANLLSAVDIVRSLDTNLLSRIAGMLGSLGMTAVSASSSNNQPIEQNVYINADFSGVSSAQEIQEAFDQLATEIGQLLYKNTK